MYKEMQPRTWEPHRGPDRKKWKEAELLETRSTAETGLRWFLDMDSYYQESREAGKADTGRRLGGSRIKHSTQRVGKPRTRGRT
jgi:hypothetical protein